MAHVRMTSSRFLETGFVVILALAGGACEADEASEPGAAAPAAAQSGLVEMTVVERGSDGRPVTGATRTLTAAEYRLMVQHKRALMDQASARPAASDGVASSQSALYVGSTGVTTGAQAGSPCDGLDVWFYDIADGWLESGRPRKIGCFRNPTQSQSGCTNFSGDGLFDARYDTDWVPFPPRVWATMVRSIWGGPCPIVMNNGPSQRLESPAWGQVNTSQTWSSLWILDRP